MSDSIDEVYTTVIPQMKDEYIRMRNSGQYNIEWFHKYYRSKGGNDVPLQTFHMVFQTANLDQVLPNIDKPDIILLCIGGNDLLAEEPVQGVIDTIALILERINQFDEDYRNGVLNFDLYSSYISGYSLWHSILTPCCQCLFHWVYQLKQSYL